MILYVLFFAALAALLLARGSRVYAQLFAFIAALMAVYAFILGRITPTEALILGAAFAILILASRPRRR